MTDEQIVLITGGGSGIGAACARRLATAGSILIVADIDGQAAQLVADACLGADVIARVVDVGDPAAVAVLIKDVVAQHGGLHVVVNSAGIAGPLAALEDYPIDAYEAVMRVNLGGVFHVMRHALPVMRGARRGVVINVASIAGHAAYRNHSAYVASKHAVVGLTKAAAREYARYGVRVVSVSPGFIATAMAAAVPAGTAERVLESVPAQRVGQASEVAELVAFLASDSAAYITGSDHVVDGGCLTQ